MKISVSSSENAPDVSTVKELIAYAAESYADISAYTFGKDGSVSFGALFRDAAEFCSLLLDKGAKGKKIAILGRNSYELVLSFLSVSCVGTAVMLDSTMNADELSHAVSCTDCEILLHSGEFAGAAEALVSESGVEFALCFDDMPELLEQGRAAAGAGRVSFLDSSCEPEDVAVMVFTSGTTGKSKCVMLSHRNIISNAISACQYVQASGKTVLALPLSHSFGITVNLLVPLLCGISVHICSSVRYMQRDITNTHADAAVFVPMMAEFIHKQIFSQAEKQGKVDKLRRAIVFSRALRHVGIDLRQKIFSGVREALGGNLSLVICGGAAVSREVTEDLREMGIEILNGYGITECGPVVSVNLKDRNKLGSAGKILPCNEVRISDKGEIQVKGANVMKGYYNDERATAEAFTEDGWFCTGDIGRIDRDGFLYITGRIKNLIILSNGENLCPETLEQELIKLPYVRETVVFEEHGVIAAEIYCEKGKEEDISASILTLNRGLPVYKHISSVKYRHEPFEKTSSMKIKRTAAAING